VNRPVPPRAGRRASFHSPNPSADPVGRQWEKERVTQVHTPPDDHQPAAQQPRPARSRSRGLRYRAGAVTAVTAGLAAVSLLAAGGGGVATAAPHPTISQVKQKLAALTTKADKLDQELDQVKQQLTAANQRLKVVNREEARYSAQFKKMRAEVGRIAAQAYMQGSMNSTVALLTSGKPQQILNQSSILLELSSVNSAEMDQFLTVAKHLTSTQQAAKRTREGILQLKNNLGKRKASLDKLIGQEKALLAQLTPVQRTGTGPGGGGGGGTGGGGGGSGGGGPYHGPTGTQAEKAVAFAYAQLGCPYVWGGTGPCSSGFDCSGLTSQAWAHAGVAIPRTSGEQWAGLPHVSTSALQPGDILVFNGATHVGIYVGNGMLIDAPQTGMDVEKVALAGWYQSTLIGAVRP
jgi:peptidoglycan DL-endopeptidase CwlO